MLKSLDVLFYPRFSKFIELVPWYFVQFQVKELRNELRVKTEELRNKEERVKNLTREKQLLEQKVSRLERNKTEEVKFKHFKVIEKVFI
jgi:hypothetical protein